MVDGLEVDGGMGGWRWMKGWVGGGGWSGGWAGGGWRDGWVEVDGVVNGLEVAWLRRGIEK